MISKGNKHWFSRYTPPASLFAVHGIGYYEKMRSCIINRPEGTGDILLMLFHDPVKVGYDGKIVNLKAESLVVWSSGMGHYYGNPEKPFRHSWLHCAGTQAIKLMPQVEMGIIAPQKEIKILFLQLLQSLYSECCLTCCDPIILRNYFHNFLLFMQRQTKKTDREHIPEPFVKLQNFLGRNFSESYTLTEIAAMVSMSVPHFCSQYKRYFRTTVFTHITNLRMDEALYLLRDQNLAIGNIAGRVGYPDIYHFSKQFKKHYGISPSAKRSQLI